MATRNAGVNYQALAAEFRVGVRVMPYGASKDFAGRVTAVWPAIGMVDVQFPGGSKRYPVEGLQRLDDRGEVDPPYISSVPGGPGTVPVAGGPYPASPLKVASTFLKTSLYWGAKDRQYKATQTEIDSNCFTCPKCKIGVLKKAVYRRAGGQSDRLYGCPECLWLVERDAILGHPENEEIVVGKKKA